MQLQSQAGCHYALSFLILCHSGWLTVCISIVLADNHFGLRRGWLLKWYVPHRISSSKCSLGWPVFGTLYCHERACVRGIPLRW